MSVEYLDWQQLLQACGVPLCDGTNSEAHEFVILESIGDLGESNQKMLKSYEGRVSKEVRAAEIYTRLALELPAQHHCRTQVLVYEIAICLRDPSTLDLLGL